MTKINIWTEWDLFPTKINQDRYFTYLRIIDFMTEAIVKIVVVVLPVLLQVNF